MMYVVIDNSGSMRDSSKTAIAAGLFMIFRRHAVDKEKITFYKWDHEVSEITSPRELSFAGNLEEQPIIDFISKKTPSPVILVGDGIFSRNIARVINKTGSAYLAVGCDCNMDELERLIGENNVFSWADCLTCFEVVNSRAALNGVEQ